MSTYYRFRSVERLLGREASGDIPARAGELEDLTIYFASPLELNDPLEGHRETHFKGDLIVWRNLIKHYITLLFSSAIDIYSAGGDGAVTHVNLRPEDFSETPRQVLSQIIEKIFSRQPINDYIESLAHSEREVSRLELSVHLTTLHAFILINILEEMAHHMEIDDISRLKLLSASFSNHISLRSREIKNEGNTPDITSYINLKSQIKQQSLRANAARTDDVSKGWLRLFTNFPDEFCHHIDYLIYPHWYVACFMKSFSNSALWGSYADNHKGVCLVFRSKKLRKTDHLTLRQLPFKFVKAYNWNRPKNQWHLTMPLQLPLLEVKYQPTYTKPNFFTSLINEHKDWTLSYWYTSNSNEISPCAKWLYDKSSEVLPKHRQQFQQSLSTKTADWEKESESRIILSGLYLTPEERLAKFQFSELDGIIFGINTSDDAKVKIIRKIAQHCKEFRRTDFKFYQAHFNETYTKVVSEHLKYIKFNTDGTLNTEPKMDL